MVLDIYEASRRYKLPNCAFGIGTADAPPSVFLNEAGVYEAIPEFFGPDYTNPFPRPDLLTTCAGWARPDGAAS